ncbi:MAG: LysR family transcriptional regulator [Firmicutes bacterium]|nr:LysR family transcriptional regulator [Bacillota bacterium]
MDIKNLVTFIQVAELSSFTKAAQELGYSQSTISFQIKQLEQELDCQLFERINHTVALTERGRELLTYAHQITRLADDMIDDAQEQTEIHGYIRLAMADSLCSSLLDHPYVEFRQRYPGITLRVTTAGTGEMLRLMNHNEADAILTLDSHVYNADYVIVGEEEIKTYFIASPTHPLSGVPALSVRDLLEQPFILTEKDMSYRRLFDEQLAASSLEVRPVLEMGRTDLICNLVEQGIGISFLPEYVVKERLNDGRLITLNVTDMDIRVWKQLIHHRDKWVSPQLKEVLKYCLEREF